MLLLQFLFKLPSPVGHLCPSPNHTHARASTSVATAKHIAIDPFAPDRKILHNYKLLVSGVVPRPIAFISIR